MASNMGEHTCSVLVHRCQVWCGEKSNQEQLTSNGTEALSFLAVFRHLFNVTPPSILNIQVATIHQIGGNVIWILQNLAVFGYLL